jgi:dTDP-L-rhamnose 4-epimerase
VSEFASTVARAFGRDLDAKPCGAYRFGDTRHIVSDIGRLRALGWEPKRTPADSVAEYIGWLRSQGDIQDILA